MKAYDFIKEKQIQWALNHDIPLIGSKGERGLPIYSTKLEDNLFEPLEESVRNQFQQGNGNELEGSPDSPAKMQALHSSSALGVNMFQYWQKRGLTNEIAAACGFCNKGSDFTSSIVFEEKYPIKSEFIVPPNIDVVFHNKDNSPFKRFSIECKFTEPYSPSRHDGLKEKYLESIELWFDMPALHGLSQEICPDDNRFSHLHAAQLIKHILGLKAACGKEKFRLMYLWYDAFGKEGADHRKDIDQFSEYTKRDGIHFHSMTYQELIISLSKDYRLEYSAYTKYLTDRYL